MFSLRHKLVMVMAVILYFQAFQAYALSISDDEDRKANGKTYAVHGIAYKHCSSAFKKEVCAFGMLDDACAECDLSNNDDETSGCFPGDSLVVLKGGLEKRMDHLRIGDVVTTLQNDKLETTEVLGFLDKKKNSTGKYLNLITEDGSSLFISERHTMFVREDGITKSVLGQDVKKGDQVIVSHQNGIGFSAVKEIIVSYKTGAYVPLTSAGTLLVDGVLVSSYTNVDHYLAHKLATPVRWWPSLLLDNEKSQDEEGIRTLPWIVREMATVLGLATRAEAKSVKIDNSILKMSQLATTNMGKSEF